MVTDLRRRSGVFTLRVVPDGCNPRLAGLPLKLHVSIVMWKLHQPSYLLTRQATQQEAILKSYK
jgi:hypothetical protein